MRGSRVWMAFSVICLFGLVGTGWAGPRRGPEVSEAVRRQDFSPIDGVLASLGIAARLHTIEYVASPTSGQFGGTIFARNVGNKQLSAHWVPGDPRRYGVKEIFWTTDQLDTSVWVSPEDSNAAIDQAMNTWQEVICSNLSLAKIPDEGMDWGVVQWTLGFGGVPGWYADYTHAGWLPAEFFDAIVEDGSQYILGVTFTFIWLDEDDEPTDIDHNRKADVAFRETYYNDAFEWSTAGPAWNDPEVDVESIVLHETGHGLSQGHFGKMFLDASQTTPPYSLTHLHFSPRAVMNAVYWDSQRELLGSDVGGHCSIWGSWPH